MMLFKLGCRNPQNCLQRFNVCTNLAEEQYDKQIIKQFIHLVGNYIKISRLINTFIKLIIFKENMKLRVHNFCQLLT